MPVISGLTDHLLTKHYHAGLSDRVIAEMYGISVTAVGARRRKLGLPRRRVSQDVNAALSHRWDIQSGQDSKGRVAGGHHSEHGGKALKLYLRMRLGDSLSPEQKRITNRWLDRLRARDVVICYDPERPEGWYYRARVPEDGRRVADWPADLPFPSEEFKRALDLPED